MVITWENILGYYEIKDSRELNKFLNEGFHIVACDASYKNGIGSCSIQIKNLSKEYTIKDKSFKAIGPNEAEMKSILFGIRGIKKIKNVKKILFTNDNYYAINLIFGRFSPQKDHIKKIVLQTKKELENLSIEYKAALVRSKINRKVDTKARKKFKSKEKEINERIKKRIRKVTEAMEKAKGLMCKKENDLVYLVKSQNSEKWYLVNLRDFFCLCPYWENMWKNKNNSILFTRALPCKHMCRAIKEAGYDVFEFFKTQIFRRI